MLVLVHDDGLPLGGRGEVQEEVQMADHGQDKEERQKGGRKDTAEP